jgi:hypothetical protein
MMQKYEIYAGMGGGFGGAQLHGIYEFSSAQEAERYAYDLAFDEYQSYEGSHGILSWDEVYEDCLASEWIEPGAQSEAEIECIVDDAYLEQVESWIEWKAVPVIDTIDYIDTTDADWQDLSDDVDCYCDD